MTSPEDFEHGHGPAPDTPAARERERQEALAHQARLARLNGRHTATDRDSSPRETR